MNSTLFAEPKTTRASKAVDNGGAFCEAPETGALFPAPADSSAPRKSFTTVCAAAFDIKLYTRESTNLAKTLQPPNKTKISKRLQKHGCFFSHQANFHLPQGPQAHRLMQLSDGGSRIMNTPNAGGNSITSEVMSYELLRRLIGARLVKTEMEIPYDFPDHSKKTDYVVAVDAPQGERQIAISVTRAMRAPGREYEYEHAERLINKKLLCVYFSSRNVLRRHRWAQQVLHILTDDLRKARLLRKAFKRADSELKEGVVVIVTVTKNARFLYMRDQYMNQVVEPDTDSDYDDEQPNVLYVPTELCVQADTQW